MRSAVVAAAFAAGALAVPYQKRDVSIVYDYDYETVTDIVTVTAGAEPATTSIATEVNAPAYPTTWSHHHHSWNHWSSKASSEAPTSAPAPSSAAPETSEAPAPSSYEAPTTSTYIAPTTSTYVAPTTSTYAAPSSVAPSSTKASSSAPAATSASGAKPTSYADKAVLHHNIHRANHSSPDLEWDDGLASIAADIAATCYYKHNVTAGGGGYGQNIAAGVEAENITAIITDLFYNGEVGWYDGLYGQADPDMTNFEHWGHFSQIVWSSTTHVGCATQDCSSQGLEPFASEGSNVAPYFTVCNYKDPGNYAGEYADNINSPKGETTAEWNYGL